MNKLLFLILLPFKIIYKILGFTKSILKNLFKILQIWCLFWFLHWFGVFKDIKQGFITFKKYTSLNRYQIENIAKQKICNYIDCEVEKCNESVCVY